jgi:hypothetical protein
LGVESSALNQLQGPETGVEGAVTVAVAVVEALGRALVTRSADQALDVGLHEELQHRLGDGAQEVAFSNLLHELGPCHALLGHRVLRRVQVKPDNSTLADWPDDHRAGEAAARLRQTLAGRSGAPPHVSNFHQLYGR